MDRIKEKEILKLAREYKGGTRIEYICKEIDKHYESIDFSEAALLERYLCLSKRKYHIYELLPQIYLGFILGLVSALVYEKLQSVSVGGLIVGLCIALFFVIVSIFTTNIVFRMDKKLFEEYEMSKIQKCLQIINYDK